MRTALLIVSVFSVNLAFGAENNQNENKCQPDCSGPHGVVYYLDGAGGGCLLTNWAPGVRKGLEQGGVHGEFREFIWQTGLGVMTDQTASVKYKRNKAEILADQIVAYKNEHPDRPVTLIGLSAGTAVAVFTLEALPENCPVDRVILLGSSLDAHYDVSTALTRVTGDMIVYTSNRDEILTVFVPMTGSADRKYVGTDVVGLRGFHLPDQADILTQTLYEKIETIPWSSEFSRVGDHGRHTDKTNPRFVREYLAPLVMTAGSTHDPLPTELASAELSAATDMTLFDPFTNPSLWTVSADPLALAAN
jgi:pimeloyl-ACP methyl ester carboxylesterase